MLDGQAFGMNALSVAGFRIVVYAFPPTAILNKTLTKAGYRGAMVHDSHRSLWEKGEWFTLLLGVLLANGESKLAILAMSAQFFCLASQPQHVCSICMEVIARSLVEEGFLQEGAARIARPQKDSSIGVYETKFLVLSDWCAQRVVDPQ